MKMKNRFNHIKAAAVALLACAALFPQCAMSQTIRGDFTMDGDVNISDVIALVNYVLNDKIGSLLSRGTSSIHLYFPVRSPWARGT